MTRRFKRLNVVKMTDAPEKAAELLERGFREIEETAPAKKARSPKGEKAKEISSEKSSTGSENEKDDGDGSEDDGESGEAETAAGH